VKNGQLFTTVARYGDEESVKAAVEIALSK